MACTYIDPYSRKDTTINHDCVAFTTYISLLQIVTECNEGARKMERMEEMLIISRQLDFREVRAVPLISASRWLVKKGELTRFVWETRTDEISELNRVGFEKLELLNLFNDYISFVLIYLHDWC